MKIGFLLFPGVQQLDLTGPYDVLASLPDTEMLLAAATLAPVTSSTGLVLTPNSIFATCPALDVLCVPGGAGINALLRDEAVLGFVRAQAETARYVTSVCTGALVLGAAGLLRGKRATTHWASHHLLAALGAIPVRARVVRDGNFFSGGGVTAGIDFALVLAAELRGEAAAQTVQLQLEYDPAPPFAAGTPDSAPPEVLNAVQERMAASLAERRALLEELNLA